VILLADIDKQLKTSFFACFTAIENNCDVHDFKNVELKEKM
jgi:hypothetical protein